MYAKYINDKSMLYNVHNQRINLIETIQLFWSVISMLQAYNYKQNPFISQSFIVVIHIHL